ncbi:MAG TPA: hypothetical protein VHB20_00115 [Verrucomicrobiae bacterium]|jgi:hypothetical protein|nr:hypothetical protein [Verrucomicrobiae bacterium]
MKSWFAKFMRPTAEIEAALRRSPPPMPAPGPELHGAIMRAVRAARAETPQPEARGLSRFLAWTALSACALAGLLLAAHVTAPPATPAPAAPALALAPGAMLDLGGEMPALVMAPLSNELNYVHQDLHRATQALLASFP